MHSWETIDSYRQFHPRWFESINNYQPSSEHVTVFQEISRNGWSLRRSGPWYVAETSDAHLPEQGWKLHISASTSDTTAVLRGIIPVLQSESVTFKFLVDRRIAALVNGKLWPRGAAGKFVAIYPQTIEQFRRIGNALCEELQSFAGPYILSDRRWPGSKSVFYRYGAFKLRTQLRPDGMRNLVMEAPDGELVPDKRNPFWSPPSWAPNPFPDISERRKDGSFALCNGRFTIESALAFSSRGGVYLATDHVRSDSVILKEARPRIEIGHGRVDAIDALTKEYRLLRTLQDTNFFARPIAFFHEWEHAFLVEELLPGDHLGRFSIRNNPIYWTDKPLSSMADYLESMRVLWSQVAGAIRAAHQRRIILADLSFTNIIVDSDSAKIIDLESSFEKGVDAEAGLLTPGVSSIRALQSNLSDESDDYASLSSIIFGSVMLANGFVGFHPPARYTFLRELRRDISLTEEFIQLIDDLSATNSADVADQLMQRIDTVPIIESHRPAETCVTRIRRNGPSARSKRDSSITRDRVEAACMGTVKYILEVADCKRRDRLFPADLTVYETNPCSVAYGAAGVIYAINRMSGAVPAELTTWLIDRPITRDSYPPGLYVGQSGIAWVLTELDHIERAVQIMRDARHHDLLQSSHDIMHGCSGYGMACLKLWATGAGQEFLDEAVRVGEVLLEEAQLNTRGNYWVRAGSVPLGYLFGGSGVSLFLLHLHLATGEPRWFEVGRRALDFELSYAAIRDGHIVGFPEEVVENPLDAPVLKSYWDIGSAGIAATVIRYAAVARDAELFAWAKKLESDIRRKYAVFPQLFHGLAGLGNSLLDLSIFSDDGDQLDAAWDVAEGVLLFGIEREEGVAFPGEQAARESADFATGAAGIGLFLRRLLDADDGSAPRSFNFALDELLPSDIARSVAKVRGGVRSSDIIPM